jgi:hypothetical protein
MIGRRAAAAGIKTRIGNHTFRATGITAYLKNNATLETAAAMAAHASTRTTQLYDRRRDELTLDEADRDLNGEGRARPFGPGSRERSSVPRLRPCGLRSLARRGR